MSSGPLFHALPYSADCLIQSYGFLLQLPWAQLLHSGGSEHPHSRFDILVADPLATLVTQGELTVITEPARGQHISADDPLRLLQQLQQRLLPAFPPHADYPFQGGSLGLLSYDLGRRFEWLPALATQDSSLPELAIGIYDWALVADHQQQRLTLLCHSEPRQRLQWLQQPPHPRINPPFRLTGPWSANMSRSDYAEKFSQIQNHLRWGDCYQVNLAQRFHAPYQGDSWQAFQQLLVANQAPFSAFLHLPKATLLCFSPERFLQVVDRRITTRPIKGTCRRQADPQQDRQAAAALAASPKDRAENVMIVDLLRNDIGRVALPGSVHVPELFVVESFPAVHHLVSTITAQLDPRYTPIDLLRATFPGGSVTGAPKIAAMSIIETLEPQRRGAYCGSIAYLSCCGNLDSNIVIRTLVAEQQQISIWAGGAIIADSEVDAEYQETLDKLNRLLPLLASAGFTAKTTR